jgi:hypothetical protein
VLPGGLAPSLVVKGRGGVGLAQSRASR